ncbi:uncharacterized protein B0H18DRAFT_606064 [Fomitopsis serialis]|uniref:uncharacterized protein n=1 Tax=Fomitopsis serialis TaxID=139415 RepID=UPI00200827C8|nr:uncharacterized protein B0H18DRAFT_606064 [Neoantrodia serialis]KAH9933918.1 hypothetical protein B0H18DRAFT_606064 [Neoantrodia serialis]
MNTTYIQRCMCPIPVSSEYRLDETSDSMVKVTISDGTTQLTTDMMKTIMHFFRPLVSTRTRLRRSWVDSKDANEYPTHVPSLYIRDDVTEEQRASILFMFYPFALSDQLARDLASERLIGETIEQVLGRQSEFWTYLTSTGVPTISRDCIPLAVILRGDAHMQADDMITMRKRLTRALHGTLTLLVMQHYDNQLWDLDRELAKADARIQVDEKFYVFSVVYSSRMFMVDINFPVLERDKSTKQYKWRFVNAEVMSKVWGQPPVHLHDRVDIFQALLFIEQHTYLLSRQLRLREEYVDPACVVELPYTGAGASF